MPVVYFSDDLKNIREVTSGFLKIAAADLDGGPVALKIHFGEPGNTTHVKPEWLADAAAILKGPVFVDCNVLYRGNRTRRDDHVATAKSHGFGFLPIDILDGEMGEDSVDVPVNVGRTKSAKLGRGLMKYKNCIAVTHFKGHMLTGFGGALKNIGMGLGSRAGKLDMHSIVSPYVKGSKCVACGACARECPGEAITVGDVAVIDSSRCIGCARCIAVCPQGAVDVPWDMSQSVNRILMEKVVEYAHAAIEGRRWWYMNYITGITYDCDCLGVEQKPIMPDVGVLLSNDPVSIDQASLDLVKERNGGADPFLKKHGIDGQHMLEYAEKIGLGTRKYKLI